MHAGWGHYNEVVNAAEFAMFMLAWGLLALDAGQQVRRLRKRQRREGEWRGDSID